MNLTPLEIRDTLVNYWYTNYNYTPTVYQNSTQPDDVNTQNPFVLFSIRFEDSETLYKGGTISRYHGFISTHVRSPLMSGNRKAYEIADEVASVLNLKRIGTIVTNSSIVGLSGEIDGYFTLPINTPFKIM